METETTLAAGAAAMNRVFGHHPSTIHGRDGRCPDCHAKPGDSRSSQPIDDLTLGIWADSVMKRWGIRAQSGLLRIEGSQE
jgi:hypothetical protein